jgi:mannitol 2-dehydrogenase
MTPAAYVDLIDGRFANPQIVDTVRRVAFDGSSRHTGFILPTLRDALAAGTPVDGLALSQALWARMCAGTREDGSVIEPNDPIWDSLQPAAVSAQTNPQAWLDQIDLYGDLASDETFKSTFSKWLGMIWENGTEAALNTYLNS